MLERTVDRTDFARLEGRLATVENDVGDIKGDLRALRSEMTDRFDAVNQRFDRQQTGFDARFVPLHVYYLQALDLMWDHLQRGRPLPPSQVVRTTPRAVTDGRTAPIAPANVPRIEHALGANTLIGFGVDGVLRIPQ